MRLSRLILLLAMIAAVAVYARGLDGPFLLDDHIHITQNRWVKIESLDPTSLARAWSSSFSAFPNDRPLAQLSFGVNHALSGLDARAFKATNLALHLLTGFMVFVFSRLAYRCVAGPEADVDRGRWLAVLTAAAWLLVPLHVSTVLYTVQRMAQISSLAMLLAISGYLWGRLQLAAGRPGLGWMLAAAPIAALGFFGKENTVLVPLLLLVCELTLLRDVALGTRRRAVHLVWLLYIAVPLLAGALYLVTHMQQFHYDGRPFTLEQRLLTEARVLWSYIRWLLIPDISQLGLYHDDIPISTGWTTPPSTLAAVLAWLALVIAAVGLRRRLPVFAFAVLFFLANHALESTVIPLEIAYEHRNYLASVGPLLLLSYLVVSATSAGVSRLATPLAAFLLLAYAGATFIRAGNWSSYQDFALSTALHHPDSPRASFMAGQFLISTLGDPQGDVAQRAQTARFFLNNGLQAEPHCWNCLFGLIVLDLQLGGQPDAAVIARLREGLQSRFVGPTEVSVSHFSFLVRWQQGDHTRLPAEVVESLFETALRNPHWTHTARAGIEAAYRDYFELVNIDLEAAARHARAAVQAWPEQWGYHFGLARVLGKLGRLDEARQALDAAERVATNDTQRRRTADARDNLEQISRI